MAEPENQENIKNQERVTGGFSPKMDGRRGEHGYAPPSERPEEKGYRPTAPPVSELPPPRNPGPAEPPPDRE